MMLHIVGMVATVLLAAAPLANAQTYPTRDMKVVIGLPAGSGGSARRRAPNLNSFDRFLLCLGSLFVPPSRESLSSRPS